MVLYDPESLYDAEMDRRRNKAEANADTDEELRAIDEDYMADRIGREMPEVDERY